MRLVALVTSLVASGYISDTVLAQNLYNYLPYHYEFSLDIQHDELIRTLRTHQQGRRQAAAITTAPTNTTTNSTIGLNSTLATDTNSDLNSTFALVNTLAALSNGTLNSTMGSNDTLITNNTVNLNSTVGMNTTSPTNITTNITVPIVPPDVNLTDLTSNGTFLVNSSISINGTSLSSLVELMNNTASASIEAPTSTILPTSTTEVLNATSTTALLDDTSTTVQPSATNTTSGPDASQVMSALSSAIENQSATTAPNATHTALENLISNALANLTSIAATNATSTTDTNATITPVSNATSSASLETTSTVDTTATAASTGMAATGGTDTSTNPYLPDGTSTSNSSVASNATSTAATSPASAPASTSVAMTTTSDASSSASVASVEPAAVPMTFEERTLYYGDMLSTLKYFEVANYTSHFELLSIRNYVETIQVNELMGVALPVPAGSPAYVKPMQVYADACGEFCTNHTGGCNGFGFRFVDASQDNVCVLFNFTLRYDMDGFSCDALCPSGNGIMMNVFYPKLPKCNQEDFFGWQNAGELQTNLLDHGCNPYLAIGDKCSSIFASWIQVPGIGLTGCPANSTCADGRIPYAKSCETDESLKEYNNEALYQEELRQNFTTDYANGLYDQMLGKDDWEGKVKSPVGYSMPLPDTLLALPQEQYDLTWQVSQGVSKLDNINDYSQACALQCSANTTCIGFTVVYILNDPRTQCRFLPNSAVPPDKNWEFTALRCSSSNPCPSGNNIPMRLYIPDSYKNCGPDMFLGYDLGLYNQIKNYNCHHTLAIGEDCGIETPQFDVTNHNAGCGDRLKCTDSSPYYKCQLALYDPFNDPATVNEYVNEIMIPGKKVEFLGTAPLEKHGKIFGVAEANSTVFQDYGACAKACVDAPPCEIFQLSVELSMCELTPYTYEEYVDLPHGDITGKLEVLTGQVYTPKVIPEVRNKR